MTIKEAAQLIAIVVGAMPQYQDKELTPTARTWALILGDIDYKTAEMALFSVMRTWTSSFFPPPGLIVEAAHNMRNTTPAAEIAWQEVTKKLNPYQGPTWSDPLIGEAVRVLGYRNLCSSENPVADRAHFFKVYESLQKRQRADRETETVRRLVQKTTILIGGKENGIRL